jgi:hypothetical protein
MPLDCSLSLPRTRAARWRREPAVREHCVLPRAALGAREVHLHNERADVAHAHHSAADGGEAAWGRGGRRVQVLSSNGATLCRLRAPQSMLGPQATPTYRLRLELPHMQRRLGVIVQPHRDIPWALGCRRQLRAALLVHHKQCLVLAGQGTAHR